MKYLLKIAAIATFILSSLVAFAQQDDENWEEIYTEENLVFSVQHHASRITKTVNTIVRVQNLNDYKVFVQFTPVFYCNGENAAPQKLDLENTYLGIGKEDKSSLHSFQICTTGQSPLVKIEDLLINETGELDAAKNVKHE